MGYRDCQLHGSRGSFTKQACLARPLSHPFPLLGRKGAVMLVFRGKANQRKQPMNLLVSPLPNGGRGRGVGAVEADSDAAARERDAEENKNRPQRRRPRGRPPRGAPLPNRGRGRAPCPRKSCDFLGTPVSALRGGGVGLAEPVR